MKKNEVLLSSQLGGSEELVLRKKEVSEINVRQMKEAFPKLITDIDADEKTRQQIIQEIEFILEPKGKSKTPLNSPQIIVLS